MFKKEEFGSHPEFWKNARTLWQRARTTGNHEIAFGPTYKFKEKRDLHHPEIFLIPRNSPYNVLDELEEAVFLPSIIDFPFSSYNFCIDEEYGGIFAEIMRGRQFSRLGQISQLGYLVPPRPKDWEPGKRIAYLPPVFPHTRWLHSLIAATLMEIVLGRNEFSEKERLLVVLTAGSHDIATPAGGDPIINMDPYELNEEKNFSLVMEESGLAQRWSVKFGFNLQVAQEWVESRGKFGLLLDVLDKISYVMVDCYAAGIERPGRIRNFCLEHPFLGDIWQDIEFTEDRKSFGFTCPERAYNFLVLRALESVELLLNPDSRKLDLYLVRYLKPLYQEGKITKDQLLSMDNYQLEALLRKLFPKEFTSWIIEPDLMSWRRFRNLKEVENFSRKIGEKKIERIEEIKPFNPGLYFPIFLENKVFKIQEVLEPNKIKDLENLALERVGYYVYYYQ